MRARKYEIPTPHLRTAGRGPLAASAQVASHAPTAIAKTPSAQSSPLQVSDKPVARVNGAVLTDRDLLREMYAIFPYAQQHNGFPKAQEAAIRQGALEMIIFEELVYQEAERRKLTVPAEKLNRAEADFRKQFNSPDQYQQYLQTEMHGSEQQLRQQMRRSLLIEQVLKTDVETQGCRIAGRSAGLLREERGALPAAGDVHFPEHFRGAAAQGHRRAGQASAEEGRGCAAPGQGDEELPGVSGCWRKRSPKTISG